VTDTGIS